MTEQNQELCNKYLIVFSKQFTKTDEETEYFIKNKKLSCRIIENRGYKFLTIFRDIKVIYQQLI